MAKQKPPECKGKLTGIPYGDLWEESGDIRERLYDHGIDRALIDRAFDEARALGADHLLLTVEQMQAIIAPLGLAPEEQARLAERLYYLAGHYYSPRFHKLFGDSPAEARALLRRVASTAAKLDGLMSKATDSLWRQVSLVRLQQHKARRGDADLKFPKLQNYVADLATAARIVADEFPVPGRGMTEKVLLRRWLKYSAEALEEATGKKIRTKILGSGAGDHRCEGVEGEVFEAYCRTVDKGITSATIVQAVRAFAK